MLVKVSKGVGVGSMSFRHSYANLKPIATTVIVIANDSALRLASRAKLFGSCLFAQVSPQATLLLYPKLGKIAIAVRVQLKVGVAVHH